MGDGVAFFISNFCCCLERPVERCLVCLSRFRDKMMGIEKGSSNSSSRKSRKGFIQFFGDDDEEEEDSFQEPGTKIGKSHDSENNNNGNKSSPTAASSSNKQVNRLDSSDANFNRQESGSPKNK